MNCREITFDDLDLRDEDIHLAMGSSGYHPDAEMVMYIEQLKDEIRQVCKPAFGYLFFPVEKIEEREIQLSGQIFHPGKIITGCLKNAEQIVLFVATAGISFDNWLHRIKKTGDILKEFIADAIGSEIAEATVRKAMQELEKQIDDKYMMSYPYSPGYCGWHVREQHILFSLLPPSPCGIALGESSLMTPIKSVSGIVAVGPEVIKAAYGCEICGKADCYKKRTKKD